MRKTRKDHAADILRMLQTCSTQEHIDNLLRHPDTVKKLAKLTARQRLAIKNLYQEESSK